MALIVVDKTVSPAQFAGPAKRSIFLAGPCPRGPAASSWKSTWHAEAVRLLEQAGFDGHVFIPLPFVGDYLDGIAWEDHFLNLADVILFWVPRKLPDMPGFTTNIEFGEWMKSGKVVLGYPEDAEKMRYLDAKAQSFKVPVTHDLSAALGLCLDMLGDGVERTGGEIYVPLHIWKNAYFQKWYASQRMAGNTLVKARLLWEFRMPKARKTFCWILHAEWFVASENRIKSNEFVFTRSDIACVMAVCPAAQLLDSQILVVKEFRVPARTPDGFVHEIPGGSSLKDGEDPLTVAAHELEEETGLRIDPRRIRSVGGRQLAATLSSHKAELFVATVTEAELASVEGSSAGVAADTELTYVSRCSVRDVLEGRVPMDWSMVGMVCGALLVDHPGLVPFESSVGAVLNKIRLGNRL